VVGVKETCARLWWELKKRKDQVEGALVFEVRSAAALRKIFKIRLIELTAQAIAGGVKQNLEKPYSLQTLNPKPVNPGPEPCTVDPKH
jgi:Trm5-related predicted tRNA methylase